MHRRPGRDRKAVLIPAPTGSPRTAQPHRVIVVGGGIAGLAAACGLVERGVAVDLVEPEGQLGGRVRAWQTESAAGSVSMSRGFHAFFRQYYNLRALLGRAGDVTKLLRPVEDYPVVSARGDRDSFARILRVPPWNFISFVLRSPTFTARDLIRVDIDMALSLLDVDFPDTYRQLDGISAHEFLDRLKFPDRARHLALEVFARSFFADPREFSAGELVAMFHTYFIGSAEGLLFDVPRDDFDTSLWAPLGAALQEQGIRRVSGSVTSVAHPSPAGRWSVVLDDGQRLEADAVVLAAGPEQTRTIVQSSSASLVADGGEKWCESVGRIRVAPPFAVLRLWFDSLVQADRPAFLGTAEFGILDNITVLERFEAGARRWSAEHGGSVVELHAYALSSDPRGDVAQQETLVDVLRAELARVYPETAHLGVVAQELLIESDCALIGLDSWEDRPGVSTPWPGLVLAGDWVRCELPIALMERAATTGWMAANQLLQDWGIAGHELWSPPMKGRHRWPGPLRRLVRRFARSARSYRS